MKTNEPNPIFDGGDVDEGHWYGSEMGCLTCGEVKPMVIGITPRYLVAELLCGGCLTEFCEVSI